MIINVCFLIADILQIQSRDTLRHTYFTCPSHLLIDLVAPSTEVTSAAAVAGCAWLLLLTCEQLSKPGNNGDFDGDTWIPVWNMEGKKTKKMEDIS